ncbi:MAG: type II toxin-antitoxin system VapB family antitoxin [Myxococcota bacterium]
MKTTIDIADSLLAEAKRRAARDHTTVRALVEAGLRLVVHAGAKPGTFRLRDASFHGQGTQPGIAEGDWEQIRSLIYAEHGA